MEVQVNFVALFAAGIASQIIGFIYYSPFVLGKPWMKLMGLSEKDVKPKGAEMAKLYGTSFVLALLSAFVLSHVMTMSMNFFGYGPIYTGIMTAFWMWLGFVMPVQLTDYLFSNKKFKLFAINTGYQLITILVMGIIVGYLY